MSSSKPVVVQVVNNGNSGIGTAGLIFSCLGWLTCGLLAPLGALFSFLGLFCRGSKSHAIAGLIVGFPGVLFLFVSGFGIIAGFLGIAGGTAAVLAEAKKKAESQQVSPMLPNPSAENNAPVESQQTTEPSNQVQADSPSETIADSAQALPAAAETALPTLPKAPVEETKPVEQQLRLWTSADGKFKTEAKLVEVKGENIVLEKAGGKIVTIAAAKLSEADQEFAKSFEPRPAGLTEDLLELIGEVQDGTLAIRCYAFTRVDSKEAIISRCKELVATMTPGKEVAYLFNTKKGIEEFIEARQSGAVLTPRVEKWMRDSHFAQIAFMSLGKDGSRWELRQVNKAADRKFNNKMDPIPLSDAVSQ